MTTHIQADIDYNKRASFRQSGTARLKAGWGRGEDRATPLAFPRTCSEYHVASYPTKGFVWRRRAKVPKVPSQDSCTSHTLPRFRSPTHTSWCCSRVLKGQIQKVGQLGGGRVVRTAFSFLRESTEQGARLWDLETIWNQCPDLVPQGPFPGVR